MALVNILRILALSFVLFSGKDDGAYELFSIGSQLELEGKTSEAIEYYKRAHAIEPRSVEINISLAGALYSVQEFDEGIAFAKAALEMEPDNVRLHQMIALGYVGKRDLTEALEYYEKALEYAPRNPELYFAIATLLEASRQVPKAISLLERMPEDIRSPESYARLAALAGRMNDHMSAVDFYRQGYALDTTDITTIIGMATGFEMLGIQDSSILYYEKVLSDTLIINVAQRLMDLYTEKDRYDDVMRLAAEILKHDEYNNHVRRSLGFAYYKRGDFLSALNEFHVALRQDPGDTYSAFYLARIYLEQGEYDRSLREIEGALRINPDFIELWIYLGFVAVEKEDYALAQHAFTEAAYRGGDLAQIYYLLGAVMETREMDQDAYFYYKKALEENPNNVATLQALASLSSRIGRDDETLEIFRTILEVDTLNAVALNYVGYTYAERNDSLNYALQLINRALEIDVDNGYYIDSRGWVFYKMGRYEEALRELKRANEIVEDAVILEHLGDVYMKLDDREKAREAYEKAVELDVGNKSLKKKLDSVQ
ncbi:MAG: tetratricopeptide repeat protein [candidate division WOR-3 bacterium]|nr:MAG: tetratricopeptide repeat protein [candidate division WOR-3 bacterium]